MGMSKCIPQVHYLDAAADADRFLEQLRLTPSDERSGDELTHAVASVIQAGAGDHDHLRGFFGTIQLRLLRNNNEVAQ